MEQTKRCKRPGCGKDYSDSLNNGAACHFHSGKPIFHDIKKGWECCQKIVYDWDDFQKIEGCCIGPHSDEVQDVEFWKSNTVSHAQVGAEKAEIAKMRTAADFNKEQEEKERLAKAAAAAVPQEQKPPKLNKDGKFICNNKGCKIRSFTDEENNPSACNFHSGQPIFHDLKKYWSCCNPNGDSGKDKIGYDWDEFQALPTCKVGQHEKKYA